MIKILDQKHFTLVVCHCTEVNTLAEFLDKLEYLADYGEDHNTECILSEDRCSPWGFDFAMYRTLNSTRDPKPWFTGGLIEHDGCTWGVHT